MSTKVQYFTATTLDGFIADANSSLDWLFVVERDEGDSSWDEFIDGVGALVMGATTYEWVLGHHPEMLEGPEKWREFYDDRPTWVFTHRELPRIPDIDLTFVQGEVRPVYDEIVAARPGQAIWIVGGGELVGQFDDAGLLDEIRLGVTPVTLGAGAPLLPRRITSERMRLRSVERSGQMVNLIYDVSRSRMSVVRLESAERPPPTQPVISVVAAPGVKTLRTPISSRTGMSSSGMIPPPNTAMSDASRSASRASRVLNSVMWAPESTERPIRSASSWIAVSTICSGVWCRPV